jgi:cytoskeletal protein CcmA (bactofilin family)
MNEEFSMDRATETARPAERSAFPAMPSAMQMQQQKPRPFAPAYPGTMSYGATSQETAAAEARRLIIGRGITMSGEIESCDHLIVEGSVEAALKGANLLEISESGVFYGTVEIEQATIAGRFEGDLIVSGRLTVRSTGSVTGTIVYKELAVEAGATVDGKINPISGSAMGGKKKETKKVAPRNDNATVSEGHELPLGGQSAAG